MPHIIDWYVENEIIFTRYAGEITVDELRKSLQETRDLVAQSSRTMVHIITDVGDVTKPVSPLEAMGVFREFGTNTDSGWQLIIREQSMMVKMSVAFGTSVMKTRTKIFPSFEDATNFLNEIDPTLSWDKANRTLVKA